jgi:hypothetical protein
MIEQRAHYAHMLPLNSCVRAKEHTEQNKSSGLTRATHLMVTKLITLIIPSEVTHPCPPYPISTKCSPNFPPATQNQELERANDSTLGLVPKESNQCQAISSKVGLEKSIISHLLKLEPPRGNHSSLTGEV